MRILSVENVWKIQADKRINDKVLYVCRMCHLYEKSEKKRKKNLNDILKIFRYHV